MVAAIPNRGSSDRYMIKKIPDVVFCFVSYFEQEPVTRVTGYGLGFEAAEYQRKKLTAKPWTNVLLVVNVGSLAERDLVS